MLDASDVLEILDRLDRAGLTVWLDGGWGIDALLGRHNRPHEDLDLVILRGRPKSVAVEASDLHRRKNSITPFDCPCDKS
jgi:hypothetical protein